VMGTNDDALLSKLSCVEAGYIKDDFVHCFLKRGIKRAPIINRGTYMRTESIDSYCKSFSQVVSFGSGSGWSIILSI
jgi:tRNA wybutosine-synthesizing protein 4